MSQFHVNQIATHVRDLFAAEYWVEDLDEVHNLSRMLALYSVTLLLGDPQDDPQRLVEVTDGAADRGIDALGVDPATKLIVFVQSKWRQDGTGSLDLAEVLKFLDGVRSLLGMKSETEPVHASDEIREAMHELLKTPGARIRLVTATTGADQLADQVEEPIRELLGHLNDLEGSEPIATHNHFAQGFFFDSLTEEPLIAVDLEIQIQDWGRDTEPLKIFYGRVSAAEIAGWYSTHGDDLFAENIRVVIPRSDINQGILDTIREEPERFGYYNNGITVLADSIEIGPGGALNRDVGYFRLEKASIVNGAQTVSTLGKVLGTEFEANLGHAFVLVRCIEVPSNDEQLSSRITRFANTQNEVSSQDFAFLDPQQHRLARELRVLGYEYLLRSGESPRGDDPMKVIDVRQSAVALACSDPNLSYAVTAKREVSRLFGPDGVYPALFNPGTDALRLLRAVLILRCIDEILDEVERESEGVEAGVAVHGRRIIGHLVMRDLGYEFLASPDSDLPTVLDGLRPIVEVLVEQLVEAFPENSYPGNVFKNQARCLDLLTTAGLIPEATA
ncbi:MAG: AIPR family protein [Acidimicrobiia bacterium]